MENFDILDVVIVGGGPAGLSAGIFAIRAAMKTVLIERGLPGGQMAISKDIDNYPGLRETNGFDLTDRFLEHVKGYGLEMIQREVLSIDPGEETHSILLEGGRTLTTRALIIATGGVARRLNVPGETENLGRGVSYCATCDGFFFKDKKVVVVGGGDNALEEALYLSKIASRVYLVHRRSAFRANAMLQQHVTADKNIEVILNTIVTGIEAGEEGVRAVRLRDLGKENEWRLETEGVFVFIGFSPLNQLVPHGVRKNRMGYVMTDEKCETNVPGIFVIGDLRQKYANQIVVAASDGCIAGLAAARYVELKKAGCREYYDTRNPETAVLMECA